MSEQARLENSAAKGVADLIGALGSPVWRYRWWCRLEQELPFVAARLVQKYPRQYPVRDPRA